MQRTPLSTFKLLLFKASVLSFVNLSLWAAPQKVNSLIYPVKYSESSISSSNLIGASSIQIDQSLNDLELIVWKTNFTHALEVNINVKNVNQSILPTDENGKLLSKITQLAAVPWIKVYLPNQAAQTLDVTCDSKSNFCKGVWKNFPFDPTFEGIIKIEANIRGLEGKIWSPKTTSLINKLKSTKQLNITASTFNNPYPLPSNSTQLPAKLEITKLYDFLKFPVEFSKLKLLSIYTWKFLNDSQIRSSGFFRVLHKTLFQVDNGQFLLEVLNQDTLQTFEILKDQSFWSSKESIIAFSSKALTSQNDSQMRVLEFEE